jgi:hypothetical protein
MKTRIAFLVCLLVAFAAGWLTRENGHTTNAAENPGLAAPQAGRYQIASNANRLYLIDTASGQTWVMFTGPAEWHEFAPALKK